MWETLIGTIVGGVIGWAASYSLYRVQRVSVVKDRVNEAKMNLVREVIRYRGDQKRLVGPLNEIPLVFGDDEETLRLYRSFINSDPSKDDHTQFLSDLVVHLAQSVGLPPSVQPSDITSTLQYSETNHP